MAKLEFDDAAAKSIEVVYLTPDVVATRCGILAALNLKPGERVVDIGSGPGLLAYDMAASVGASGRVLGIDTSEAMVAMSQRRCASQPWAEFEVAGATALPGQDDAFDCGVSIQVYEYLGDVPAALAELCRVLRPGGRAVIMDTDYGSLVINTEHPERMRRVLGAWDEHFVHGDLPRRLAPQLRQAGLAVKRQQAIPILNTEYHANNYSSGILALMASFAVGRKGVTQDEADAWLDEFADLGERGAFFFSLNRYLFEVEKTIA